MDYSYFEKLARSYDAKRKKQYRKMLKRMYGSDEAMIEAIRETGDPNIYHGTSNLDAKRNIMENGALKNKNIDGAFGEGTYFADKKRAMQYTRGGINNPATEDGLVRFKRPSELQGTKVTYGDVGQYKKVTKDKLDDKVRKGLQKNYPNQNEKNIDTVRKKIMNDADKVNKLEAYGTLKNKRTKGGMNLVTEHMGDLHRNQLIGTKDIDRGLLTTVTEKGVEDVKKPELPKWEPKPKQDTIKRKKVDSIKENIKDSVKTEIPKTNPIGNSSSSTKKAIGETIENNVKPGLKFGTKAKIGVGAMAATTLGTGLAYVHNRKKQKEREQRLQQQRGVY